MAGALALDHGDALRLTLSADSFHRFKEEGLRIQ